MELQRRHLEMWVALYLMEQYPQLTHAIHRAVVQRDPEVLPEWNAVVDEFAETCGGGWRWMRQRRSTT